LKVSSKITDDFAMRLQLVKAQLVGGIAEAEWVRPEEIWFSSQRVR